MTMLDPIVISKNLIKYPSITPDNTGAIDYLAEILDSWGFKCQKLVFYDQTYQAPVHNLYARIGKLGKNLCFAGHTDVVATGDIRSWFNDPFTATVIEDKVYGRGIVDMKGAIACFISALSNVIPKKKNFKNSISLLITGDEEGYATNGTPKVLEVIEKQQENIDFCLIGEPSNPNFLGEMLKIGRRGSLNMQLDVYGKQGHVAYPEYAHNPIKDLMKVFDTLLNNPFDDGNEYFQPSNLEFTSIDVGNNTCNVIPNKVTVKFNIRFNNHYTADQLIETIKSRLNAININYNLIPNISGEPFVNCNKQFCDFILQSIQSTIDITARLGTSGGTSDARFIQKICPVLEFGLVANTAHQINEHALIKDLYSLKTIYQKIIEKHMYID